MTHYFKEYCGPDQQGQLLCIISFKAGCDIEQMVVALERVKSCQSIVQQSNSNHFVVVAKAECNADTFLREVAERIENCSSDFTIEETRFGCIDPAMSGTRRLSSRFTVTAPDSREGGAQENVIYLEHGSVFGSGHHPSTRLAVKAIEECWQLDSPSSVLDVGCGSGILSFVCSRLGAEQVLGVDICRKTINIAQNNRAYNKFFDEQVRFFCGVVSEIAEQFDLIVANVSPSVLQTVIKEFPRLLSAEGKVVLAGLHSGQMDDIVRQMAGVGCEVLKSYGDGSWRALLFNAVRT